MQKGAVKEAMDELKERHQKNTMQRSEREARTNLKKRYQKKRMQGGEGQDKFENEEIPEKFAGNVGDC